MRNNLHEEFMRLAIEKAKKGITAGQTPFGACFVKDEKVISCRHNSVWGSLDITAHAEMNVIREACKKLNTVDLSGCILYSTCEPCPMCFSACHWAKIPKIFYGARIADAKKLGFNELPISCEKMKRSGKSLIKVRGNFLRQENLELFRHWQKKAPSRVY